MKELIDVQTFADIHEAAFATVIDGTLSYTQLYGDESGFLRMVWGENQDEIELYDKTIYLDSEANRIFIEPKEGEAFEIVFLDVMSI